MTEAPDSSPPHSVPRRALDWAVGIYRRASHARVALRTRIMLTFALGGLALSAFLAATTYSFTKSRLLRQRDQSALNAGYNDASLVTADLRSNPANLGDLVSRL